jgi:uncharacterized protein YjdB
MKKVLAVFLSLLLVNPFFGQSVQLSFAAESNGSGANQQESAVAQQGSVVVQGAAASTNEGAENGSSSATSDEAEGDNGAGEATADNAGSGSATQGANKNATVGALSVDDSGDPDEGTDPNPDLKTPDGKPVVTKSESLTAPVIKARAQMQSKGWTSWTEIKEGSIYTIGITGKSLRLEALALSLKTPAKLTSTTTTTQKYTDGTSDTSTTSAESTISGSIKYAVYVQGEGWKTQTATSSESLYAGTVGKSKRVEQVKIWLTGDLAEKYDIYYTVNTQVFGQLGWAHNGEAVGTTGQNMRVEAVYLKLVKKGEKAPSTNAKKPLLVKSPNVNYRVHVQTYGNMSTVSNGKTAGTTGKSKRLENIRISLNNTSFTGNIEYRAHVQTYGWQNWVKNGAEAGTHGKSKRLEAIAIKLTGDIANYYDVYYRVHVQKFGWTGWAKNGANAGSAGYSYRLEAVQIKLVPKGEAAPGSTKNTYYDGTSMNSAQRAMYNKIAKTSSKTNYIIAVNTSTCRVGIFKGSAGNWKLLKYWSCGPGASSTPTVKGTFTVQSRGYSFGSGFTCYYWTQFYGNYLFHSILYYQGTKKVKDSTLGKKVSHGCVRLDIANAKWIYNNIPKGTKVIVY